VLVAQYDAFPFQGGRPPTTWAAGEVVYDPHPLQPRDLPPGKYAVGVQVYNLTDGQRRPTVNGDPWQIVGYLER
jgi:hypothetical protein